MPEAIDAYSEMKILKAEVRGYITMFEFDADHVMSYVDTVIHVYTLVFRYRATGYDLSAVKVYPILRQFPV